MLKKRLIAVIIVRNGQVVQSVKFKHTNVIHYDVLHAVETFNDWDIDEIAILNVSKNPETKADFLKVVEKISKFCFVPLSVGGWITDIEYAGNLLRFGADKLILNTAFFENQDLVRLLSDKYGAQCIVASIDVKRDLRGLSTVWVDRARLNTSIEPLKWVQNAINIGAGEIFFNSVDHDGARNGYDLESLNKICKYSSVPVVAFGGVFTWEHLLEGLSAGADAVAAANIFHYTEQSTKKAKSFLIEKGVKIRISGTFS